MLIWSRLICAPPLGVCWHVSAASAIACLLTAVCCKRTIFAALKFVFICGETLAIVPCTIAPFFNSTVTDSFVHFMRNL